MAARYAHNVEVVGSIPTPETPFLNETIKHILECMDGMKLHYGLSVAEYKTHVDPTAKNIDLLLEWARGAIRNFDIRIGDENYEVLLGAPEHFEVTDTQERQLFFRTVFMECMKNAQPEATAENDEPVYPTEQTKLQRAHGL